MRSENFNEKQETLMNPYKVALVASQLSCGKFTGQLIRVM
jgi:hypothetical protein